MKSLALSLSTALAAILFSSGSQAAVKLKLAKTNQPTALSKRHILPRQHINLELVNNITGGSYSAKISVGTPPQELRLTIDTGSSDVWFLSSDAIVCTDPFLVHYYGGCSSTFDPNESSTIQIAAEDAFNISYVDQSGAAGDYIFDDIIIGDKKITAQTLGLAYDASLTSGVMGIGFSLNVASNSPRLQTPFTYPTMIDQMFDQGFISLKAYSLFLDSKDSATGTVIFGGLDSDKYVGNLFQLPIVPTQLKNGSEIYDHFSVVMTSLEMSNGTSNTSFTSSRFRIPVVLDSGTTLTYLPEVTARQIYTLLGAVVDTEGRDATGLVYVDCDVGSDPSVTFNYKFGDSQDTVEIRVAISELLYSLSDIFRGRDYTSLLPNLPFTNVCAFGIMPSASVALLGDTFLRSAYVVYDLTNRLVAMAQANPNSKDESIVEFKADATAIPRVSGVASTVEVTETATFVGGGAGGVGSGDRPTTTGGGGGSSVASGGGASTTTSTPKASSKSAGTRTAGDVNTNIFLIMSVSLCMAVLGGGGFFLWA